MNASPAGQTRAGGSSESRKEKNPSLHEFEAWFARAAAGLQRNVRQRLELELSAHYQDAYQALISSGVPPEEAARKALEQLGDPDSASECFHEGYAIEQPWERNFLPLKPEGADYGYLKGDKLVPCTQEELIEAASGAGYNAAEVNLAWTPDTERLVPVEQIPFLFQAIRKKRLKSAKGDLITSAVWGGILLGGGIHSLNLRHLALFLALATVLPAFAALRRQREAKLLTPEKLAAEAAQDKGGFQLWTSLQKAPLTTTLIVACSIVSLMPMVALLFNGSGEAAALVKPATWQGEWWRLLTCVFLHAGLMHLCFNAIGLAVFGHMVEVCIGRFFLPLVFLLTALCGSVFSLFLNPQPSVGASGGVLGLAGFLFVIARRPKGVTLPGIPRLAATVACFAAVTGIIGFDLFDSAAHLGGLLAGLALGWAVKAPQKLSARPLFRSAGLASCLILSAGALLAIFLMTRPAPKVAPAPSPTPQQTSASAPSLLPAPASSRKPPPTSDRRFHAAQTAYYFPSRDPATPVQCLNLEPYQNAQLKAYWQAPAYSVTFLDLPVGLQNFRGVLFDVRFALQLRGSNTLVAFPAEIRGITVAQPAARIHFLHATGQVVPDGTTIGIYSVHFTSGLRSEIPIVYGQHVREWHASKDTQAAISHGQIAWSTNTCHQTRLFHTTWTNPFPTQIIDSLSFASTLTECSPFTVAITLDHPPDTVITR